MDKLKLLKVILLLGALYYFVGAYAHFFAVTLFPFYDRALYVPYQDSVIALVAVIFALFLITIARDPVKNRDTLNTVIICVFLASVFSIAIIWKVDFMAFGAPAKKMQTIVEGIIGFIYFGILLWLYPPTNDVIIGKGDLDRKGIYAKRDFKKDTVVIKYNLKPLTKNEFENLPENEKEFTHTHWGVTYLYSEPERYVNHSESPNTYQDLANRCDRAQRDIRKGEMITTDATKDEIS